MQMAGKLVNPDLDAVVYLYKQRDVKGMGELRAEPTPALHAAPSFFAVLFLYIVV